MVVPRRIGDFCAVRRVCDVPGVCHAAVRLAQVGLVVPRRACQAAVWVSKNVALWLLVFGLMAVLPPMSTRTCILLIEDDPSLLESLRDFLEEHGFDTQTASTRLRGEEMLRKLRPAVCLLDLNLPDGSGLDLLRLIVQERLPVRVIVMSAFPLQRLRQQFPESVLAAMMTKPVSPQLLLEWVDKITRTRDAAADSP
jgi:CheY-like chemotaxis protein